MTDGVFDDNNTNQNQGGDPTPSSDDVFADKLSAIKNENGEPKYKTVEDALEALAHSQNFIAQLKQEKQTEAEKRAEIEAELSKRASVEEVVNRMLQKPNEPTTKADPPKEDSSLDESKVQQMVEQMLNSRTQEQMRADNVRKVSDELSNKFGGSVRDVLANRAKELNMTVDQVRELSAENPAMVLKLFDDVQVVDKKPTTSSQYTPRTTSSEIEPPKREKSILQGGMTSKETAEYMKQMKEYTRKRLGVTE